MKSWDRILANIEHFVARAQLKSQLTPIYTRTDGKRERLAIGLLRMLRE